MVDFYSKPKPTGTTTRYGLGFRSKTQLAFFMIWKEWWKDGEVEFAKVIFSTPVK